jgi:hypothetical protein
MLFIFFIGNLNDEMVAELIIQQETLLSLNCEHMHILVQTLQCQHFLPSSTTKFNCHKCLNESQNVK